MAVSVGAGAAYLGLSQIDGGRLFEEYALNEGGMVKLLDWLQVLTMDRGLD